VKRSFVATVILCCVMCDCVQSDKSHLINLALGLIDTALEYARTHPEAFIAHVSDSDGSTVNDASSDSE
jgi:hypothetical protein